MWWLLLVVIYTGDDFTGGWRAGGDCTSDDVLVMITCTGDDVVTVTSGDDFTGG